MQAEKHRFIQHQLLWNSLHDVIDEKMNDQPSADDSVWEILKQDLSLIESCNNLEDVSNRDKNPLGLNEEDIFFIHSISTRSETVFVTNNEP